MIRALTPIILIFASLALPEVASHCLWAGDSSGVRLQGVVTAVADYTGAFGSPEAIVGSIPAFSGRVMAQGQLVLTPDFSIPYSANLMGPVLAVQQPGNQLGFSPRFGSATSIHLGFFQPRLSNFSIGDQRLAGIGAETRFGPLSLYGAYGLFRFSRAPQSGFAGEYDRWLGAFSIGLGQEQSGFARLSILRSSDDASSLGVQEADSSLPPPRENMVVSISGAVIPSKKYSVVYEIAGSVTSPDTRTSPVTGVSPSLTRIFTPRLGTAIDGGASLLVRYQPLDRASGTSKVQFLGPGFYSDGFQQLQNDALEYLQTLDVRPISGVLAFRGSYSLRSNNVRQTRSQRTDRQSASLSATYTMSQLTTLDLQYQYNTFSRQADALIAETQQIMHSLQATPSTNLHAFGVDHSVAATILAQSISNRFGLQSQSTFNILSTLASFSQVDPEIEVQTQTTINHISDIVNTTLVGGLIGVSWRLEDGALTFSPAVGAQYVSAASTQVQGQARLGLEYRISRSSEAVLLTQINQNQISDPNQPSTVQFTQLQCSLQLRHRF